MDGFEKVANIVEAVGILFLKGITYLGLFLFLSTLAIAALDSEMRHWQPVPTTAQANNALYIMGAIPTFIVTTFIWGHIWASWAWRKKHE